MASSAKTTRRQQILEALASMLEATPGGKVTTAALAKEVGVSEAALYRHFPSKAKMFEGLIEFIEETLFTRVSAITEQNLPAMEQCNKILFLLMGFCAKNPGITRIITGDALVGETARLRARTAKLFERLETQLKQILRQAEVRDGLKVTLSVAATVSLLMAMAEGKIAQYTRSDFKRLPIEGWNDQWNCLTQGLLAQ